MVYPIASRPAGRFIILVASVGRGVKNVSSLKISVTLLLLKAAKIRTTPYTNVMIFSVMLRALIHPPCILCGQYNRKRIKVKEDDENVAAGLIEEGSFG